MFLEICNIKVEKIKCDTIFVHGAFRSNMKWDIRQRGDKALRSKSRKRYEGRNFVENLLLVNLNTRLLFC